MPSEFIQQQIERLLTQAAEAIGRSEWALVHDRAEDVLALDPDNADARTLLTAAERRLASRSAEPSLAREGGAGDAPSSVQVRPATTSGQPASFAAGRYQMARLLGEGATKKVYLARDTRLDRDVALSLIRTDALDEAGLARVRREAQAMARLGDHPNVVAVYDIGEEGGQPYIVSQLMQGGDVEGLLKGADDHRLSLEQALKIAGQICAALEHAHQHGIVHRDLKPGNVWLMQDGTAKLGDFGLAIALDRSRLTQAGMMVGTVSYMPPEQALAGEVTPRSDLYALGCMLYEMVCGRPPFVADESIAIITQHLNIPPIAPTWHRAECPSSLEALILRLLEKDPAKRPSTAADVRRQLAAIDFTPAVHTGLTQVQPTPYGAQDNPLYRRTFVGREPELRQLQAAFDSILSGNGGLVMVVGEPGIGKTALCEQLATYASVRGGRTIAGHCYEEGSFSLPYLAFVEAIRTYILNRPPEDLRAELGSGAADVARIVSEVRERVAVELRPAGDPEEDRYRLLQAVTEFLRSASTSQPLVLVLEDLHWADRGTLDLLQHLARNLSGSRLLIVGTYRDVEVDRAHPLAAALAELRRSGTVNRVALRGLTPDEVQRMLAGLADQEVPWGLAEAVHRQTEGNPLFIQEVVRYLVEEGLLTREEGRPQRSGDTPLVMAIPEGLRDVIGRRMDRLSPECNRLLSIAAVIGRDFALETLQAVANQSEEQVLAGLEEAVRVGVVEEQTRPGGLHYRFAHAFFRQTLYEEMFTPRRLRMHQQVARVLEAQYAARLEEHAAELVEHFAQSSDPGDLRKAVAYGEMAARRAVGVYAYSEAVRLLEQALEAQDEADRNDQATRCDLLLALGEALMPAGDPLRAAQVVAEEAFTLAEAVGDRQRASHACRMALDGLWRYGTMTMVQTPAWHQWTERADRYADDGTVDRVYADIARSQELTVRAADDQAGPLRRQALKLARKLDDRRAEFHAALEVYLRSFSAHEAEERFRLAEEYSQRSHEGISPRVLSQLLHSAGLTFMEHGDLQRAEECWHRLEVLGTRTSDPTTLLWTIINEGVLARLEGRLEDAVAAGDRLVTRAQELGSPVFGWQHYTETSIPALVSLGRTDEALAAIPQAALAAGRQGVLDRVQLGWKIAILAHAGDRDGADTLLGQVLERIPNPDLSIQLILPLLTAAVLAGRQDLVGRFSQVLAPVAGLVTAQSLSGSVARALGGAAALLGDRAQARQYYEQALEVCGKINFRPEIALTHLEMAELCLAEAQDASGEHAAQFQREAQNHLAFCIPEFEAMKMRPALERATRLQEAIHAE